MQFTFIYLVAASANDSLTSLSVFLDLFQEVFRNVRSILNKLTPQKFTPLMEKISNLPINTEERLRGVIELVFEKVSF